MSKNRRQVKKKTFGEEIIAALEEFNRTLKKGGAIESRYTVHRYEIPEPTRFTPSDIKALRHRLSVSQTVFANLLGVSPVLVEHWERGIRTPHPVACRLLETIARNPAAYVKQYIHQKAG